jgi:hypothetical protein
LIEKLEIKVPVKRTKVKEEPKKASAGKRKQ